MRDLGSGKTKNSLVFKKFLECIPDEPKIPNYFNSGQMKYIIHNNNY